MKRLSMKPAPARQPQGSDDSGPLQPVFSGGLHASCMTTHLSHRASRPTRVVLLVAIAAVAATVALPTPARTAEPLRSGTILAAAPDTSDYTWLWPWPGCNGAPACWTWTEAGCPDEGVGLEPAMTSSIELVSELADGTTLRTLEFHSAGPAGLATGRLVVEFWNGGCRQMFTSPGEYHIFCAPNDCPEFPIPARAHWMTITSKPSNANIEWTLT